MQAKSFRAWSYQNKQWVGLSEYTRHLPLVTNYFDLSSFLLRIVWLQILKIFFKFYLRLDVKGEDLKTLTDKYPKLLIVSNHASHLDAIAIASVIPLSGWIYFYTSVAKDYFFSDIWMSFFSKHCIQAVPVERSGYIRQSLKLCIDLISRLNKIWLLIFPEGTRSLDGKVQPFKRGVNLIAKKTQTPVLFLFLKGSFDLWPKGVRFLPPGGKLTIYIGPVWTFDSPKELYDSYKEWIHTL